MSRADLLDVHVPKSVWSRSGRPLQGRISRTLFGTMMLLLGMTLPWPAIGWGLVVVGVLGFFLIPVATDFLIERREPGILAISSPDEATREIEALDKSVLVSAFAPDAWVTLQRGRLHIALGDGRAAAQAFADTARVLQQPQMPELLGAQARALMLADDRSAARTHLVALDEADSLGPRDQLWLGVVLLDEAAKAQSAREHLEAAFEGLDGHPQAAAALAIALARTKEPESVERALDLLERAESEVDDADVLAPGLIKRARKALRPARDAAKKKRKKKK